MNVKHNCSKGDIKTTRSGINSRNMPALSLSSAKSFIAAAQIMIAAALTGPVLSFAEISQATAQSSTIPTQLNVLSYDIYMRPSLDSILEAYKSEIVDLANEVAPGLTDFTEADLAGVTTLESPDQSERVGRIMSWMDDEGLPWDVIVWGEAFWQTLAPQDLETFKGLLNDRGYIHHTAVVAIPDSPLTLNGGVFISSKWPIEAEDQYIYNAVCGEDLFSDKGVAYAKVNKLGMNYHIFGTHLQGSMPVLPCLTSVDDFINFMKVELVNSVDIIGVPTLLQIPLQDPVMTRLNQLLEFSDYVDTKNIPSAELVVLAGNLHVDLFESANPASPLFEEYTAMLEALSSLTNPAAEARDTNTDSLTQQAAANGPWSYDELSNTLAEGSQALLDYVLYRYSHDRILTSSRVIQAKTSPDNLDLSDHYPVSAFFNLDIDPPVVTCDSADDIWHAEDVGIACTAVDAGSGLANPDDAAFFLWTSVAEGAETNNAFTSSRDVCDIGGNCITVSPIGGNKVDKKAPVIFILEPTAKEYASTSTLELNYTVTDNGSGVATVFPTMDGNTTVAGSGLSSGLVINLLTDLPLGTHTFAVNADDQVGNVSDESSITFTITVDPQIIIDAVIQLSQSGDIRRQLVQPLAAKLRNAQRLINRDKVKPALNIYRAFMNQVRAQTGKGISPEASRILTASAKYLISTVMVDPQSIIYRLIQLNQSGDVRDQRMKPLLAKLRNAQSLMRRGKSRPALNMYRGFIKKVQAQSDRGISPEAAAQLIENAQALIDEIRTSSTRQSRLN